MNVIVIPVLTCCYYVDVISIIVIFIGIIGNDWWWRIIDW